MLNNHTGSYHQVGVGIIDGGILAGGDALYELFALYLH